MLHFHKAELKDSAVIAGLINSAYRGESSRAGWTTEADLLDGLRTNAKEIASIIEEVHTFILLGVLNDEVVATICCKYHEGAAHFGMIAVKPKLQNKGYGKEMIIAAEAMTKREWGVKSFQMNVITLRISLIAFYERLGYAHTGLVKDFPHQSDLWQPKVNGLALALLEKSLK